MRYSLIAVVIAAALLSGCAVGPNYARPAVPVPANFRAPEPLPAPHAASLADLKWFEIFKDEQLQELTRTALVQNYDLARRGGARRAGARESRASRAPINFRKSSASGDMEFTRLSRDGSLPLPAYVCAEPESQLGTRHRSTCCRSKSISGDACAGRPKPRAPIC